jgi:hypothetical protein
VVEQDAQARSENMMIDHPEIASRLIEQLRAALPIPASLAPEVHAEMQEKTGDAALPSKGEVTGIHYTGDDGGIVCRLGFGPNVRDPAYSSITHLRFDARLPLTRQIAMYQKHRRKNLRKHGRTGGVFNLQE